MNWTALILITLGVCLIWELDEKQTVKKRQKHREKGRETDGILHEKYYAPG